MPWRPARSRSTATRRCWTSCSTCSKRRPAASRSSRPSGAAAGTSSSQLRPAGLEDWPTVSLPEAVGIAAWCFLVALAGGVVGLVLGNLRLPIVLLVASSPATGGAANIAISGVAASAASIGHVRAGRINWRLFRWMAPPSVAGALVGGYAAGAISDALLLSVIAAVLLYSGVDLLRWERPPAAATDAADPG